MNEIDVSLINWSRGQFALTALYHWLFVPLTLGLSFIMAFMETMYYRTGDEEWKRITKFWMTLFGVNFAIGVATGLILEFEFGTNWSNYSWFVGDIFGAPLAIEGIMAFFLESTFIAVMFFGWGKVSKRFHLLSTWLVAFGSNLSALWILVANAWMQYPVGMRFNPVTVRNEMMNFWDVFLSPVAINKFLHTISSGFVLASVFVIGVSAWFLLRRREVLLAQRSILIAAVFGLVSSLFLIFTGDGSAKLVFRHQPMKMAAIEGLYKGQRQAGLVAVGVVTPGKKINDNKDPYIFQLRIPYMLSLLATNDPNSFIPGIEDLVEGNEQHGLISVKDKISRGKLAISALDNYNRALKQNDTVALREAKAMLDDNFCYFGYGYLNGPESVIPNVPMIFYSFRLMVILGFWFILLFALILFFTLKRKTDKAGWLLYASLWSIPLAYIATMAGWIVAEMGRQPWVIQDLMPVSAAVTQIDAQAVQLTFWIFAFIFTTLLIADITIMVQQVKTGPKT